MTRKGKGVAKLNLRAAPTKQKELGSTYMFYRMLDIILLN